MLQITMGFLHPWSKSIEHPTLQSLVCLYKQSLSQIPVRCQRPPYCFFNSFLSIYSLYCPRCSCLSPTKLITDSFSMWKKRGNLWDWGKSWEILWAQREAKSIMVMSHFIPLPLFIQSEKFELSHASPMACSVHIHCQVKEWILNFLQTRKDYSTDISSTQKCHRYLKNIQAHSVSSSFIPWQKCCICFEEESCHSRWTMREQDFRAVPRATFFYLSYGYTHHKCLTFGTHDMDSCKLQYSLGSREAAWIRRMNSAELTSSLTHLPLWMPQSDAGQEPRGRYLQTLALLQLLFLVPN